MTALGKLFRTTTFKLTLVYLVVFALFAAFLLGYFALNTRRLITQQINDTVTAELTGLSEQYRLGGVRRLVDDVVRQPVVERLCQQRLAPDRERAAPLCRAGATGGDRVSGHRC